MKNINLPFRKLADNARPSVAQSSNLRIDSVQIVKRTFVFPRFFDYPAGIVSVFSHLRYDVLLSCNRGL